MHKDLLTHSPLLMLPLLALFVFLAVFLLVVLRAMTTAKHEVARAASLPLDEEDRHER